MQRIEVITGKERRRYWSEEEQLRIVAEAEAPGAIQKEVALNNGRIIRGNKGFDEETLKRALTFLEDT